MNSQHKKRPCRVCRKWFMPHPRLGDRQMTCGSEECQRTWHSRKCAQWNRHNRSYFRDRYIRNRLEDVVPVKPPEPSPPPPLPSSPMRSPPSPPVSPPPRRHYSETIFQEVIGAKQAVIIEYLARLLLKGCSRGDIGITY